MRVIEWKHLQISWLIGHPEGKKKAQEIWFNKLRLLINNTWFALFPYET